MEVVIVAPRSMEDVHRAGEPLALAESHCEFATITCAAGLELGGMAGNFSLDIGCLLQVFEGLCQYFNGFPQFANFHLKLNDSSLLGRLCCGLHFHLRLCKGRARKRGENSQTEQNSH